MATKLTPEEKALETVMTRKLTLAMLVSDPDIANHEAALSRRKALTGQKDRHASAMVDFQSGDALTRAVEGFKVKAAVASVARAQGLQPNGSAIPAPAIVVPTAPEGSDAEGETANA